MYWGMYGVVAGLAVAFTAPVPARACDGAPIAGYRCNPATAMVQSVAAGVILQDPETPERCGWLGVRLEAPDPALARQLKLDDGGLVITNICVGSPADDSGIQLYDVLIRCDGQQVKADPQSLACLIKSRGPGAQMPLVVLRQASELSLNCTLGRWPVQGNWTWKVADAPEMLLKEEFEVGGSILRRGPNGQIMVESRALPELPGHLRVFLPEMQQKTVELIQQDGGSTMKCTAVKNGVAYEILKGADGNIRVKQTVHKEGREQVDERTYEDEEALQAEDQEAYEVYAGPPHIEAHLAGPVVRGGNHAGAHATTPEWVKWEELMGLGLAELNRGTDPAVGTWVSQSPVQGPARFTFRVETDGTILVVIRRGDGELHKSYRSVAEFQEKSPELFERFAELETSD